MGNYRIYFILTAIFALFLAFIIGKAITTGESGYLFFSLFGLAYLGVVQLMTGVYLLSKYKQYPTWAKTGIRNYWLFTGSYLALWISQIFWPIISETAFGIWLITGPLFIATYQFRLIWRMAGLRRRQLEKRAFLQIYSH